MNKSQKILAAIGGTSLVGALVLGYLVWSAADEKGEREDNLEGAVADARNVMRKLPVKVDNASLAIFKENVAAYDAWRAEAEKVAARGDLVFESTTPAVFKTELVDEARRIAALPGCFEGKFAKADFGFGFKDYVTGGAMPPDDAKALKRLQREWNDVTYVLKTLAECGGAGAGVVELTMGGMAKPADEEAQVPSRGKKQNRANKPNRGKPKGKAKAPAEEERADGPAITAFTVEFMARPSVFVKIVNALTTGQRFTVIENFTFARDNDALAAALSSGDHEGDARRARPRSRQLQQPETIEAQDNGPMLVTDPATAPLLKVKMSVSVYDFGTLERAKAEAEKADVKKAKEGESK